MGCSNTYINKFASQSFLLSNLTNLRFISHAQKLGLLKIECDTYDIVTLCELREKMSLIVVAWHVDPPGFEHGTILENKNAPPPSNDIYKNNPSKDMGSQYTVICTIHMGFIKFQNHFHTFICFTSYYIHCFVSRLKYIYTRIRH